MTPITNSRKEPTPKDLNRENLVDVVQHWRRSIPPRIREAVLFTLHNK